MRAKDAADPVRMCVICHKRFPKKMLVRYILSDEQTLLMDREQKKPGRGFYVCFDPHCEQKFGKFRAGSRVRRG